MRVWTTTSSESSESSDMTSTTGAFLTTFFAGVAFFFCIDVVSTVGRERECETHGSDGSLLDDLFDLLLGLRLCNLLLRLQFLQQ